MKGFSKTAIIIFLVVAVLWTGLTFWAQSEGPSQQWELGNPKSSKKVLIVYDPDPFYNLDEQVYRFFG
ncbi:MAG: hypothetical protein H7329_09340 [Opitutaceae bacterium]|nr:hypothetical protein [Cytophagales bacterium]